MPLPHDIAVWLDNAWDAADSAEVGKKKAMPRANYNGMELKALINLDAAKSGDPLIVVRVRKAAP
jgi:hypothetical protein